jgi:hypothetical protein
MIALHVCFVRKWPIAQLCRRQIGGREILIEYRARHNTDERHSVRVLSGWLW